MTHDVYKSHRTAPTASTACVLSAASFPAVCSADDALAWPVSQVHRELNSPASGLGTLLKSAVTDIAVYHRPGGPVTHDYLIACIQLADRALSGGQARIWARCERNPGSIPGGITKLYRDAAPALDTVKFSNMRPKLKGDNDVPIMMCAYDELRFKHLVQLLSIIHTESPKYGLASYNCWWFAAVVIHTLEMESVDCDWIIRPSKDWAKRVIQVLGKNTGATSKQVAQQFETWWYASHRRVSMHTHLNRQVQDALVNAPGAELRTHPTRELELVARSDHIPPQIALCRPPPPVPQHRYVPRPSCASNSAVSEKNGLVMPPYSVTYAEAKAVPVHRRPLPSPIPPRSPLRLQHAVCETAKEEPAAGTKAYEYSFYPPFASNGSILSLRECQIANDRKPPVYLPCANEPPRRLYVDTLPPRHCLPPSYRDPASPPLLSSYGAKLSPLPLFCGPEVTHAASIGGPEIPSLLPSYEFGDIKRSRLPLCGPAVTRTPSTGGRPLPEIPLSAQETRFASQISPALEPSPPAYELHSSEYAPLPPEKQAPQESEPPEYLPPSEYFIPRDAVPFELGSAAIPLDQIDHALPSLGLHEAIRMKDMRKDPSDVRNLEATRESDSSVHEMSPTPQDATSPIPAASTGSACRSSTPMGRPSQFHSSRRDLPPAPFPPAEAEAETVGDIREVLRRVADLQLIVERQAKDIETLARIVAAQYPSQHRASASASALQHQPLLPTAGPNRTEDNRLMRGPQHEKSDDYYELSLLPDGQTKGNLPRIVITNPLGRRTEALHNLPIRPQPPASWNGYQGSPELRAQDIPQSATILSWHPRSAPSNG